MFAWIFRNRQRLEVMYGAPDRPRPLTVPDWIDAGGMVDDGPTAAPRRRVRFVVYEMIPRPRRTARFVSDAGASAGRFGQEAA